ncbi:2-keto-4-pentenoate hydratase [Synergistales bacterium]|nr:2-keto-4-pentenoate hydratase [Synergistales bacterium]
MSYARTVEFADELYKAEISCSPITPLTETDPGITPENAYAVQLHNVKRNIAKRVISGKKIGLTSKGIQIQLGVNTPDYGHLFKDMERPDGKLLSAAFIQPKIEAEIAYVLKDDLKGGALTPDDVLKATDYVVCSFEIVDSRVKDWKIKLADTIADNASSAAYVLGAKKVSPASIDLASVSMKLYKNGALVNEGSGAEVMGNPSLSVAWLANKLWEYGVALKKGEVVLSGAFTAAPLAVKGDVFEARFSDLGDLAAEFV